MGDSSLAPKARLGRLRAASPTPDTRSVAFQPPSHPRTKARSPRRPNLHTAQQLEFPGMASASNQSGARRERILSKGKERKRQSYG